MRMSSSEDVRFLYAQSAAGVDYISVRKQPPCTIRYGYTICLSLRERCRGTRRRGLSLRTPALPHVHYFAFFLKKDGTKKASRGSVAAPGTYPAYDVPVIRAAVCDFLPLRLFDEMRIGEIRPYTFRTSVCGHRGCNPAFIL